MLSCPNGTISIECLPDFKGYHFLLLLLVVEILCLMLTLVYMYTFRQNRELEMKTAVYPILNHFNTVVKAIHFIIIMLVITFSIIIFFSKQAKQTLLNYLLFAICIIFLYSLVLIPQVQYILHLLLAIQRLLLYFIPSSEKYVNLSEKAMGRLIKVLYVLCFIKDVWGFVQLIRNFYEAWSSRFLERIMGILIILQVISALAYIPVIISIRKLTNLVSIEKYKPHKYIFYQMMASLAIRSPFVFFIVIAGLAHGDVTALLTQTLEPVEYTLNSREMSSISNVTSFSDSILSDMPIEICLIWLIYYFWLFVLPILTLIYMYTFRQNREVDKKTAVYPILIIIIKDFAFLCVVFSENQYSKTMYGIFIIIIEILIFLQVISAIAYIPVIISIRKLTNLVSIEKYKPHKYIFYKMIASLILRLPSLSMILCNEFGFSFNIYILLPLLEMCMTPLGIQLAYLLANRRNVRVLLSFSFKNRIKALLFPNSRPYQVAPEVVESTRY